MSKKRVREYRGELGNPIVITIGLFDGIDFNDPGAFSREWEKRLREKQLAKLPLLFAHYGIMPSADAGAMLTLILRMASKHVKGFGVAPYKKPPKRDEAGMWAHVKLKKLEQPGRSISVICGELCKPGKPFKGESAGEIRRAFYRVERGMLGRVIEDMPPEEQAKTIRRAFDIAGTRSVQR